jgi:hypothetical protein
MKYMLALILVAMGVTPNETPSQRAMCTFVETVSAGQWTCQRLATWARKGHDELPRSLASKLPPPPAEDDVTDTDDSAERISNGF